MRILYFTDGYAKKVMGTKRSIAKEIASRGHILISKSVGEVKNILNLIKLTNPDYIFLMRTGLVIPPQVKKRIKIPVLGFDFGGGTRGKSITNINKSYDLYVTAHYETFLKCKDQIPLHYNPTACDFQFHKKMDLKKNIDMSMIGIARHPSFHNKNLRKEIADRLRVDLPDYTLRTFGKGWEGKHIVGQKFLNIINRSKIGLDIQEIWRPLAHRMFEYAACGVPNITYDRPEVFMHFVKDKEILTYTTYEELLEKLNYYLDHEDLLKKIGMAALKRCKADHNISNRIDKLLDFLDKN